MYKIILPLVFILMFTSIYAQTTNLFDKNLIKNPGAEAEDENNQIPNWQVGQQLQDATILNDTYGHVAGEWDWNCSEKCGLPPHAGTHYFRLPVDSDNPELSLSQSINLASIKDTLAKRKVNFNLSVYTTGLNCEQKSCSFSTLSIIFYDAAGNEIKRYENKEDSHDFASVSSDDDRMRKFIQESLGNEVPADAAKAVVNVDAKKGCCEDNYVFFDNFSLVLTKGAMRDNK